MVYARCLAKTFWQFVRLPSYERKIFLRDLSEFLGMAV
jgi:hypothetical protein